jgi:hypothetical protein
MLTSSPWSFPNYTVNGKQWGPTTHWVSWFMQQFNTEVSLYQTKDGFAGAGADLRFLLAKKFIATFDSKIDCNTSFYDPTSVRFL